MPLINADRVRETTTVAGTGSATLLGAVTGYQSFAVVGNTNTCYYVIAEQGGSNWEVGIGTYSTTGPTIARTTVLSSSNAGSLVSFPAGTKDIFLAYPAEKAVTTQSLYTPDSFVGTFVDGVAVDYVTGNGRISVGANDNLTFYTGGVAGTAVTTLKYQGQVNFTPLASNPSGAGGGDLYYNSTSGRFQYYNGTAWYPFGQTVTISDTAPSSPLSGDLWWESDTGTLYIYYVDANSSQWVQAAGGGGSGSTVYPAGGGSDQIFYENGQTVTTSYTLTSGKNAMTAGPITINAGATVTVPSGQNWVIL